MHFLPCTAKTDVLEITKKLRCVDFHVPLTCSANKSIVNLIKPLQRKKSA